MPYGYRLGYRRRSYSFRRKRTRPVPYIGSGRLSFSRPIKRSRLLCASCMHCYH